jgi:pimeloyl-ACP methyl ester carboxylesterase
VWLGVDAVDLLSGGDVAWWAAGAKVAFAMGAAGTIRWITDHLGDAARYDRIVVVGHSLGGVIAYDAVRLLWRERWATRTSTSTWTTPRSRLRAGRWSTPWLPVATQPRSGPGSVPRMPTCSRRWRQRTRIAG